MARFNAAGLLPLVGQAPLGDQANSYVCRGVAMGNLEQTRQSGIERFYGKNL